MRLTYLGVVLTAVAVAGCPANNLVGSGGLAFGGGGGGGTGPDALAFTVQPNGAVAGEIINSGTAGGIQVTVRDTLGRPDSAFTANVTIAIDKNPVGGNLAGTTSVPPFNGIALFGDLIIDRAGSGYTLKASASRATSTTSSSFTILAP